jgi:hypothetical protein
MLDIEKIDNIIPGVIFHIRLLPVNKALLLDRKTSLMIFPAIGSFLGKNTTLNNISKIMDMKIDFHKVMEGLVEGLSSLNDSEYEKYILDMFSGITVDESGKPAIELNSMENLNKVFQKRLLSIYRLLVEVMRLNKFSFFELVEKMGGLDMSQINGLDSVEKDKKK